MHCFVFKYSILQASQVYMYLTMLILTNCLFSIAETSSFTQTHVCYIQLTTVFLFQISQYFPFVGHICCLLQLNLFFHIMVFVFVSLCVTWLGTCSKGGTLTIGLENGLERQEIIYVSYDGFEKICFI